MIKGWEKLELYNVFDLLKGSGLSKEKLNVEGKHRCILYGELFTAYKEKIKQVHSKTNFNEGTYSKKYDLLMPGSTTTSGIDLAKASIVLQDGIRLGGDINIFRPKKKVDTLFFAYKISNIRNQVIMYTQGTTIVHLQPKKLLSLKIQFPNKFEEQNAIAETLNNVDELIEKLEKLIEKKKHIKQGVMQQLLTGKKRLLGFNNPWNKTIITELVNRFATGLNPRQNFTLNKGGYCKYVTIKDFSNNKISFASCDTITKQDMLTINKRSDLRENDILFSSIGRIGDIYLIKEDPINWNINESVFSLRPNNDVVNPKYLMYSFLSDIFKNEMTKLISGSTLSSIKMNQLKELSIKIPTDLKEQTAIANILSDIDKDIELLENKLIKYQQIKAGMMQQLLTGKIRLINDAEEVEVKNHNQTFNDAVIFASIVAACHHPDYHLGRKKAQKLLYMFKRFDNQSVEQFGHYAAGPYDQTARYGGFESLAIRNKYVVEHKSAKGSCFTPGENIDKAKEYCNKFGYDKFLPIFDKWLKFLSAEDLELYTTIDKAILELKQQNKKINFNAVKTLIAQDQAWRSKLQKEVFRDINIQEAMNFSQNILGVNL